MNVSELRSLGNPEFFLWDIEELTFLEILDFVQITVDSELVEHFPL